MDHFGIGPAIMGAASIYLTAARRTGRTTSLLNSLKDGDRVIFASVSEARRVEALCVDRGLKIDCIVVAVQDADDLFSNGTSQGRTLFDHTWVEQYYTNSLEAAYKRIDWFQEQLSGYGEAHRKTRAAAENIVKWRFNHPKDK